MPSDELKTTLREVASGVLSGRAAFRLIVSGQYGASQIETIIRHLEITRTVFSSEESAMIEEDVEWAE